MRNAGLEETQAGIKIAKRNINNLRAGVSLRRENDQISDQKPFISKLVYFIESKSFCDPGSDGDPASLCVYGRMVRLADHPCPCSGSAAS